MNTHLPPQWAHRVQAILNAHGWETGAWVHQTQRFLAAWAQAEGGTATWNPLNTTLHFMGSTSYNTASVQNYTKPIYGVMATTLTLVNGHYNGIVGAIQGGTLTAEEIINKNSAEISTWGTNVAIVLQVLETIP